MMRRQAQSPWRLAALILLGGESSASGSASDQRHGTADGNQHVGSDAGTSRRRPDLAGVRAGDERPERPAGGIEGIRRAEVSDQHLARLQDRAMTEWALGFRAAATPTSSRHPMIRCLPAGVPRLNATRIRSRRANGGLIVDPLRVTNQIRQISSKAARTEGSGAELCRFGPVGRRRLVVETVDSTLDLARRHWPSEATRCG